MIPPIKGNFTTSSDHLFDVVMKDQEIDHFQSLKNTAPLSAELVLGQVPSLKEPRLIGDWTLWLEQRPNEGGRTTVLIRPFGHPGLCPQELTPFPINLRSRVHDYGGGVLATARKGNQLILAWIDDCDGCLWTQSFEGLSSKKKAFRLIPLHPPSCLSRQGEFSLADGLIDLERNRWLGVMEQAGKDFLVTFCLSLTNQKPTVIYQPKDFLGYAVLSPHGDQLAWVEWQYPAMPWDVSQLWWASFDADGQFHQKTCLAGNSKDLSKKISVFQPIWLESGELVVSENSNGWWNLMASSSVIKPEQSPKWNRLWPMKSDTAMPQWVYGMSTISASGSEILSINCKQGKWQINLLSLDGQSRLIKQPFNDLSSLDANENRVVIIASNCYNGPGLFELDLNTNSWHHKQVFDAGLSKQVISVGEDFWFKGYRGKLTHAWYYPPINSHFEQPPLLVKTHSGPTSMASSGLNLDIQFWTSRGWAVVDVNYGGSTGFGKAYRDRLENGWGEVDVFDCAEAAKSLSALGKVDKNKIAIEGGSAGGFTTLACLCFTDIFKVAACKYAVSDLLKMAQETHRFEAGYLDYLIGPLPESTMLYRQRSPCNFASQINCPIIFFQGLKDQVVLPLQTDQMVDELRQNNVPVEVYKFSNEGHGFRDSQTKIKVLKCTEDFFNRHLKI